MGRTYSERINNHNTKKVQVEQKKENGIYKMGLIVTKRMDVTNLSLKGEKSALKMIDIGIGRSKREKN